MADAASVVTKTLQLPCGLGPDKEGKVHREAEIAPMTGMVRKNIARPEVRQSVAKVVDAILLACLKRVGPITKIDRRVLDKLLLGDRDFLLLEIRKHSLGPEVNATIQCGGCSEKVDLKFNLNNVPVRGLPDKDDAGGVEGTERTFWIEWESDDGKSGHKGKFRFPNGGDQLDVAPVIMKNAVEGSYRLYSRCLLEWDGQPVEKVSPTLFDDLSIPVLNEIDRVFMSKMPGPELNQPTTCPLCGVENDLDLRVSDFLFPQVRGRTPIA